MLFCCCGRSDFSAVGSLLLSIPTDPIEAKRIADKICRVALSIPAGAIEATGSRRWHQRGNGYFQYQQVRLKRPASWCELPGRSDLSIPAGAIEAAVYLLRHGYSNLFQYQQVRLNPELSRSFNDFFGSFQYQQVRLMRAYMLQNVKDRGQLSIPAGAIDAQLPRWIQFLLLSFQYQQVRLMPYRLAERALCDFLSIPAGAIDASGT